jgi:NhaP-type Na+/H+ or K+/H+ antiporter
MAAAIVEREEVPKSLRGLLNLESGVNDGIALPFVLLLLEVLRDEPLEPWRLGGEILLGAGIGWAVAWIGVYLQRLDITGVRPVFEPFTAFSIGATIFPICKLTGANEFLAAFAAGVTIASTSPQVRQQFDKFGAHVAELLKAAAVFVFAALISFSVLRDLTTWEYLFGVLTVVIARPAGLLLSMLGTSLGWRLRLAAAWFGPKGFASVVYGLFVLQSGIPEAQRLFHLISIAVGLSILAHSSTDVLVARQFNDAAESVDAVESPQEGASVS